MRVYPDNGGEKTGARQTGHNGPQALRRLGVSGPHVVFEVARVIHETGARHGLNVAQHHLYRQRVPTLLECLMANTRIEALKRLLEIDPNDEVAYFGLGKALMAEEQFAEAVDYLEKCIQVKATYSAAYLALVESLLKIDKKDRAKEVCALGHTVSTKNGDMQVTKKLEAIQATLT